MQIKSKSDEIKLLLDTITSLNQNTESLQLKLDKEVAECKRLSEEWCRINNESKVWTSEKSSYERQVSFLFKNHVVSLIYLILKLTFQILECKTKLSNSEKGVKSLQELVTVQDEQLDGFEEAILTLKNKEKQLLESIKNKEVCIYTF